MLPDEPPESLPDDSPALPDEPPPDGAVGCVGSGLGPVVPDDESLPLDPPDDDPLLLPDDELLPDAPESPKRSRSCSVCS